MAETGVDAAHPELPARLPAFGTPTLPWLPVTMRRLDWTCDRYELLAMEMVAAKMWSRVRREGVGAEALAYRMPGSGAVVRPGDIVHYARFATGMTSHRAVHVGLGLIVHVWCNTKKCTCRTMEPPGTHASGGTKAQIMLSKVTDYPWVSQAWRVSKIRPDAAPPAERAFRALASIGAINYSMLYANCDHFVDAVLDPVASHRERPSRMVVLSTALVCAAVLIMLSLLTTVVLHAAAPAPAPAPHGRHPTSLRRGPRAAPTTGRTNIQ